MDKAPDHTSRQKKHPPKRSKNFFTDIKYFFLDTPKHKTLIRFKTQRDREKYSHSVLQRTGTGVEGYKILNMHKIGIEVPATIVFDELLKWNGDSSCWPNHIARVHLQNNRLEQIKVYLFGRSQYPFGLKNGIFGWDYLHLFNLSALKIKRVPSPFDIDNARYLLYKSSGGYPIGVFSMYVRSSIQKEPETERSQLYFMVGFNFYGKGFWSKINIINLIWEAIHNRVTANVMNRFKQLCEWRFEKLQEGQYGI